MDSFNLNSTTKTPEIDFNPDTHTLIMNGRSLPENAENFYAPLKKWMIEYYNTLPQKATFNINLRYYNTASSKMILELLNITKKAINNGSEIKVVWGCEKNDEDAKEDVKDFADIVGIPIELKII